MNTILDQIKNDLNVLTILEERLVRELGKDNEIVAERMAFKETLSSILKGIFELERDFSEEHDSEEYKKWAEILGVDPSSLKFDGVESSNLTRFLARQRRPKVNGPWNRR